MQGLSLTSAIGLAVLFSARLVGSASVLAASKARGLRHSGASFISSLEFSHKLRVCNAYPYTLPIDVYLGQEKLTSSAMNYKECGEFRPNLKVGDKIDFKVGDSSAGSFSVSDLPENDAVLMLVIYRHDTMSTAVSFESHVFSNLLNAQVAVIDTYRGKAKSQPHIQDVRAKKEGDQEVRSEELRYDSVVAVNPGVYEVVLKGSESDGKARSRLVALNKESYLVVRCGVEAMQGKSYPEEIMVYPESDPRQLSGATSNRPLFVAALAFLVTMASSSFAA